MNPAKVHYDFIDLAKGVAILLVVMGHIFQYNLTGISTNVCLDFIYSFHMPLFMFLSGWVATLGRDKLTKVSAADFVLKKAKQLLVPFFVWGLIVTPLFIRQNTLSEWPDIARLLILQPDTGAWFLLSLFCIQCYYLVACLIGNALRKIFGQYADFLGLSTILAGILILTKYVGGSFYWPIIYFCSFLAGVFAPVLYRNWGGVK